MKANAEDILDKIRDKEFLREFIAKARAETATHDIHRTRVAVELLLARTIADGAEDLGKKLSEHADALVKASEAGDRHANSLKWATWALVLATIVLASIQACSGLRG